MMKMLPQKMQCNYGNRTNFYRIREAGEAIQNIQETEDDTPFSDVISSSTSKLNPYDNHVTSQITDTASLPSAQASEYKDAESAYSHQSSSGFHTFIELQPPMLQKVEDGLSIPYYSVSTSNSYQGQFSAVPDIDFTSATQGEKDRNTIGSGLAYMPEGHSGFPSWENVLENRSAGVQPISFEPTLSASQASGINAMHGGANDMLRQAFTDNVGKRQEFGGHSDGMEQW